LNVEVENHGNASREVDIVTEVLAGEKLVARFPSISTNVAAGVTGSVNSTVRISKPVLWGPAPAQTPYLYRAVTTVSSNKVVIDTYEPIFWDSFGNL